jgi:hypothetical protein
VRTVINVSRQCRPPIIGQGTKPKVAQILCGGTVEAVEARA